MLEKESLSAEAVASYKLTMKLLGTLRDVVDLECYPTIVDIKGKLYTCASVRKKYTEPITGLWP